MRREVVALGVVDDDLRPASGYAMGTANAGHSLWKKIAVGVCDIHGLPWIVAT